MLRDQLAALNEEGIINAARNWYRMQRPPASKELESVATDGPTQRRAILLRQLASLAKGASVNNRKLLLRVEYHPPR